jgi:lipopolysaccharide export system protein LptA
MKLFKNLILYIFLLIIILTQKNICLLSSTKHKTQNPFTRISITSNKALCQKDKKNQNIYTFHYIDNVIVLFADGSKVSADTLEIVFDNKTGTQPTLTPIQNNKKFLSKFKKITFKNNVHVISSNRSAWADRAELFPTTQICQLEGHVKIQQIKDQPKDIPLSIESEKAVLNLDTNELTFLGSTANPVSTMIEIDQNVKISSRSNSKPAAVTPQIT